MMENWSKNGAVYKCNVCGLRGSDIPSCEHCAPPKPKKRKKAVAEVQVEDVISDVK